LRIEERVPEEKRKEAQELIHYILSNSFGLLNYREKLPQELKGNLRALGAAEGNINKILANRFKKRGMSWSKRGANSLAKVNAMRENGDLEDCISRQYGRKRVPPSISRKMKEKLKREVQGLEENILAALLALHGPHSGRPWVQVLREIARVKVDFGLN